MSIRSEHLVSNTRVAKRIDVVAILVATIFSLLFVQLIPSPADSSTARKRLPNIVLIVMDTVRADHLSCYGYERQTSPRLDKFASGATRYTRAIASAPWTIPSHASIFTGKDPFQHGAHRMEVDGELVKNPLPAAHFTLAEMFDNEGYLTAAIVANDVFLSPKWRVEPV